MSERLSFITTVQFPDGIDHDLVLGITSTGMTCKLFAYSHFSPPRWTSLDLIILITLIIITLITLIILIIPIIIMLPVFDDFCCFLAVAGCLRPSTTHQRCNSQVLRGMRVEAKDSPCGKKWIGHIGHPRFRHPKTGSFP